jgi:hypothetical protein
MWTMSHLEDALFGYRTLAVTVMPAVKEPPTGGDEPMPVMAQNCTDSPDTCVGSTCLTADTCVGSTCLTADTCVGSTCLTADTCVGSSCLGSGDSGGGCLDGDSCIGSDSLCHSDSVCEQDSHCMDTIPLILPDVAEPAAPDCADSGAPEQDAPLKPDAMRVVGLDLPALRAQLDCALSARV